MVQRNFILFIGLFCSTLLYAQAPTLEIRGYVESEDGKALEEASAELFEGTTKRQSVKSNSRGIFQLQLEYSKNYSIIISKKGMIQKRIDFVTEIPVDKQRKLMKEFAVKLVDDCEGADVSIFKQPVDIVKFDSKKGNFVSDEAHFQKMQNGIASAYTQLEKCKADKFERKKSEADKAFAQEDFEKAESLYKEALKLSPYDSYIKRQLASSIKNNEKQGLEQNRFELLVSEGDQYFNQNQLTAAKQRYQEAATINPASQVVLEKLKKIEQLNAQKAEQQKQFAETNRKYDEAIKRANTALASQDYPLAQENFQEASKLKPSEALPKQKLAQTQQLINKQVQDRLEQEQLTKSFNEALAQGQAAFAKGDFVAAETHYKKALALKPNEQLPRKKISEAQNQHQAVQQQTLAKQRAEVESNYTEAIQKADAHVGQKEFDNALEGYNGALQIKPSDVYAQKQIKKVNNLLIEQELEKQEQVENEYAQAMNAGDTKKNSKDFVGAIDAYKQALQQKPADVVASQKIEESQGLLLDQRNVEKEEVEHRAVYRNLIKKGDEQLKAKNYALAKDNFKLALEQYPEEQYPINKIAEIDNVLTLNEQEDEYKQIIKEGDQFFTIQEFDKAIVAYKRAKILAPLKDYPQSRINEISKIVSQQMLDKKQAEFDQTVALAEQQTTLKKYEEAKSLYKKAGLMLPESQIPQKRINEINVLISGQSKSATEQKYKEYKDQAETMIAQKQYVKAKQLYKKASEVVPENPYPQQRINEINEMIDALNKNSADQKYALVLQQADALYGQKKYVEAKEVYKNALKERPGDTYPTQKINEINGALSRNSRAQIESQYDSHIKTGDSYYKSGNFDLAIVSYTNALKVLPEKDYPQQKINEINSRLTEKTRLENQKKERRAAYNSAIAMADKYFAEKNYKLSSNEYSKALNLFPTESYPKGQLEKIDRLKAEDQKLALEQKDRDNQYRKTITQADVLFKDKQYTEAKGLYQKALLIKVEDVHSSVQIQRIDQILAQKEAEMLNSEAGEKRFVELVKNGDLKFKSQSYDQARASYAEALKIKPDDAYVRGQINVTDKRLKLLKSKAVATNNTTNKAQPSPALDKLNFKNDSERTNYLNSLKKSYRSGITLEIYKENNKTTKRYIVIRDDEVHEYRSVSYTWGGAEFTADGKPTNGLYLRSVIRPQEGESVYESKTVEY